MTKLISTELKTKLDKAKVKMLLYKNGAFLTSLLCTTPVYIKDLDHLAETDGLSISISKKSLENYPEEYIITLLSHELWHIARLHNLRKDDREDSTWNKACDFVINNALFDEGYKGIREMDGCWNPEYIGMAEEEIYNLLESEDNEKFSWEGKDLIYSSDSDSKEEKDAQEQAKKRQQMMNIQQALTLTKDCSSNAVDAVKQLIEDQLAPKVNWKKAVKLFLLDALSEESSWSRRSRRYPDKYMPGKLKENDRLTHLAFFIDTSGSISEEEIQQIQAELRSIHKNLKPSKMTIVQFDHVIEDEMVIYEDSKWKPLTIKGFGGTSLIPVRNWIEKNKPTASVIFSDLCCPSMEYIKAPILWIAVNTNFTPDFGKTIHIEV